MSEAQHGTFLDVAAVPRICIPRLAVRVIHEDAEDPILTLKYTRRTQLIVSGAQHGTFLALATMLWLCIPRLAVTVMSEHLEEPKFASKRNVGRTFWHSWLLL